MKEKAQVVIISLWILVMLTVLAVGIGHRVSLALKLSSYQRDKVKALYLAKAGVNKVISELDKDKNNYDSLNEPWSDNKELFEKILPADDPVEFASVNYIVGPQDSQETRFGAVDEESKININIAPKGLLAEFFSRAGALDPADIANNICAWRGDTDMVIPEYSGKGYANKAGKFVNTGELVLVRGIDPEILAAAGDLITVNGSGKVNINTVSREVLEIHISYCVQQLAERNVADRDPEDMVNRIIDARLKGANFSSVSELEASLGDVAQHSGPRNILNELNPLIDFKSSCYYMVSNGKIRNKIFAEVKCIYDKTAKKIRFWHEK